MTPTPSPEQAQRLREHASALAALVPRAAHPEGGFGWLDPTNTLAPDEPVRTWITCRMTHVAALEVLRRGDDSLRPVLDVGHRALTGRLRDGTHGGWLPAVGGGAAQPTDKVAYAHAFVVLAAASLTAARHRGGAALLAEALDVFDTHFWDEDAGMSREQFDAAWSTCEDYRGVNANMHTVEALLATGQVLHDDTYVDRAVRIIRRVVHGFAAEAAWRLPEHFDGRWQVLSDYNRDRPADQFRPYGVTIGHLLEWSRLSLNARAALGARAADPSYGWMVTDAAALFAAAVSRGWGVDGAEGFVYTTDFEDIPIVRERLHWVVCEAIAAAWTLFEVTGEAGYQRWYDTFWAYADRHLVDRDHGGWRHELSPTNEPSDSIWWGKPDVYHAYQCTLVPLLPGMGSFAGALRG
jgi:mannose/cellobiose epimerase-like protein (N-acyl-D-glucosamine 2-epimerase family)